MALGDVVQQSAMVSTTGLLSLPAAPTSGNRVLLLIASSESGLEFVIDDGAWTRVANVSQQDGQVRRVSLYSDDNAPQSVTIGTYGADLAAQLVELEGLGGPLLETGTMTTGFNSPSTLPIELDAAVASSGGAVAAFVTGNASREFDNSSWTGGYSHGNQARPSTNARMTWGYRGIDGTSSVWATSVDYSDSAANSSGAMVAFQEAPPTALDVPTGFTFTAHASQRQLNGSWTAVSGADSYDVEVEYETDPDVWVSLTSFNQVGTSFTLDNNDGVDWETTYRARVRAVTT